MIKEKEDSFIGTEFPTPKGGILKVIEYAGKKVGGCKIYKVHCSECTKDPELFGNGVFEKAKNDLIRGSIPCGCSKNTQWTAYQWEVLISRKLKDKNIRFKMPTKTGRTKKSDRVECFCEIDNHIWTPTIASIIHENTGCPKCAARATGDRLRSKNPEYKLQSKLTEKCYEFIRWDTVSGEYEDAFCYFIYSCPKHGEQRGRCADFVRTRGCGCPICKIEVSRVYGWYEERQEDMDMLYVINFDNKYLKVGRTFEIETRLRHLKIQSNINNLEILHLYNDIHSKIYPLEQIIHKRLKSLGFWKNVGWTTECFELEALPYVYEILEGLNE